MIYNIIGKIYGISKRVFLKIHRQITGMYTIFLLKINGVDLGKNIRSNGVPIIDFGWSKTKVVIGDNFKMNNGIRYNIIGRQAPCCLVVRNAAHISDFAELTIGHNVGMSSSTIVCHKKITIGNNVKIGGNCVIYDTDFHSLDAGIRRVALEDQRNYGCKDVHIGNDVFIGAHSTILKGVSIGDNSIIGACSVVTKSVPANQIWAGNPAKLVRNI